jgi:hypothetical protein
LPATVEEAERLAEVIGVIAKLVHLKKGKFFFQNCGGKSITKKLIPKIKKVESSAPTIAFVNEDSYHLLFYGYQCNVCFFTRKLQEYRIYLDLQNIYEDLRKAVGDESMPFTFDELLNWAGPLEMVVDHRNKTPEMMEVLQNEWTAKGLVKIAPLHRSIEINWLKRKLETLTKESDDTTEQKKDLEMKITRLESETLEERNQRKEEDDRKKEDARKRKEEEAQQKEEARKRKEEEDDRKKEDARKRKEEEAQRKEEARKRKEEEDDRKKEDARKRKEEEDDRKKEDARKQKEEEAQQKEEARKRKEEEDDRKKEDARKRKEEEAQRMEEGRKRKEKARQQEKEQVEQARQRMKEQEEHAQQQKEEQEEQVPKARGKYKTFDDRMEDLKLFKEAHGHVNVSISEDNSLAQF